MSKIEPRLKGEKISHRAWETHLQSQFWKTVSNGKWLSLTIYRGACVCGHDHNPWNSSTVVRHRGSPGWFQQLRNSRQSEGRSAGFLWNQALESADRKRQHTEEVDPSLHRTHGSFPQSPLFQMWHPCHVVDLCPLLKVLDSDWLFTKSTTVSLASWAGCANVLKTHPVSFPPGCVHHDFLPGPHCYKHLMCGVFWPHPCRLSRHPAAVPEKSRCWRCWRWSKIPFTAHLSFALQSQRDWCDILGFLWGSNVIISTNSLSQLLPRGKNSVSGSRYPCPTADGTWVNHAGHVEWGVRLSSAWLLIMQMTSYKVH